MSALTLSFLLGYGLALWAPWQDSKTNAGHTAQASRSPELYSGSSFALPVAAQQAWFPPIASYFDSGKPLEDEKFNALLRILQERMDAKETTADFEREAGFYFDSFLRRIAASKLTPAQIQNADDYLLGLARQYPEHLVMIEQERQLLKNYGPKRKPLKAIAVSDTWFPGVETLDTGGEPFADETIDELIDVLDGLLAAPEGVFSSRAVTQIHVGHFLARLKLGILTDPQTARVDTYLDQLKERYPDESKFLDQCRHQVRNLLAGRAALNIVGRDLDGVEFELSEHRGDIVVLYFSGQWCAPCRGEYPYQRFMLELFKDEPVTILGVNSDKDIGTIREAKEREGLDYRVWWDGYGKKRRPTKGPIHTAWNVTRWPTIYILDERGVIRFAQKRHAEVITAVNKLLKEKKSSLVH